jgi:cell division protein ZapA
MKQLEVQIMGQSYLLGCPEGGEDRLRDAVGKVDAAMCKIRDAGKLKARDRIAVLAALNLAFELSERASVPASPAAGDSAAEGATHGPTDGAAAIAPQQLSALLAKLDQALGDDGQLL